MSVNLLTKSIGVHGQWGLSSVFDFLEVYEKVQTAKVKQMKSKAAETRVQEIHDTPNRLNILFINPGDIRHIISALSRKRRYMLQKNADTKFPEIHLYLLEQNNELMARHLILLTVFLHLEMPIRQKTNSFFEIYGNIKIQRRTKQLIEQLSKDLISLITSKNNPASNNTTNAVSSSHSILLQQLLSFDLFHFRDYDLLMNALLHYQSSSKMAFKIDELYNTRQRGLLEDRYDQRQALYDWDYHQNYKRTATIIHIKQYKTWRETGIGYEFGDQVYNEPNPTFISYTEGVMKKGSKKGEKQEVLGYWGDIVEGPFLGLGINSDSNGNKHAEGLYEILNKVFYFSSFLLF
jgi:dynein assembly factor 3